MSEKGRRRAASSRGRISRSHLEVAKPQDLVQRARSEEGTRLALHRRQRQTIDAKPMQQRRPRGRTHLASHRPALSVRASVRVHTPIEVQRVTRRRT